MFELGIRWTAAIVAAWGVAQYRVPGSSVVLKAAGLLAAYSLLLYLAERRGLRSASVSALAACADAACVAAMLAASSQLDRFGFLVLAPLAYAASRFGASPAIMAPIAAGALLAADGALGAGTFAAPLLGQAAAVLATGLLLNDRRVVVTIAHPVLPFEAATSDDSLRLRESFRRLKEMYQDLDRQSRRDRNAVQIAQARGGVGPLAQELAAKLRDLTGAESLGLYSVAQLDGRLVARAHSGPYPAPIRDASLPLEMSWGVRQATQATFEAVEKLLPASEYGAHGNVPLRLNGRIVGLACLLHSDPDRLHEALEIAAELADQAAALLSEEEAKEAIERRARSAELLYELAHGLAGAKTSTAAAARAVSQLHEIGPFDHVAAYWLDGSEPILAAHAGRSSRYFETISFAGGPGIGGWLAIGAPEILVFDVFGDMRCSSSEAAPQRIGSYALLPIRFGEQPFGFLSAATSQVGGIDVEDGERLRALCAELTHAVARLEGADLHAHGLATAGELQKAIADGPAGQLVYLEPHRRQQLIEQFGKAAFDSALIQYSRRLKDRLPSGSLVARRPEGDYVVLLRGVSAEFAISWANEASALASFIGLSAAPGAARVPLAMRAKVAELASQKGEILERIAS